MVGLSTAAGRRRQGTTLPVFRYIASKRASKPGYTPRGVGHYSQYGATVGLTPVRVELASYGLCFDIIESEEEPARCITDWAMLNVGCLSNAEEAQSVVVSPATEKS